MSSHARPAASRHRLLLATLLPFFFLHCPAASAQQLTPDDAALMLLNSARKAFNDKNHAFAAERFREFLAKHGGHKEATAAPLRSATGAARRPDEGLSSGAGTAPASRRRAGLCRSTLRSVLPRLRTPGTRPSGLGLGRREATGSSTAPQHGKPALRSSGGAVYGINASLCGAREAATRRRCERASR